MDSANGLVDGMFTCEVINIRLKRSIGESARRADENSILLDIIRRGSIHTYKTLIRCLRETKQNGVVLLLEPPAADDRGQLTKQQILRLRENYSSSISKLESNYGLVAAMFSKDLITLRMKQAIESAPTEAERNQRIFEVVTQGTAEQFSVFTQCLIETGQRTVARSLSGKTEAESGSFCPSHARSLSNTLINRLRGGRFNATRNWSFSSTEEFCVWSEDGNDAVNTIRVTFCSEDSVRDSST